MSIDVSKAPDGATHYWPRQGESGGLWYADRGDHLEVWDGRQWAPSGNRIGDKVHREMTPIPTFEPFLGVEDAPAVGSKHDPATAKQASPKGAGAPILGMVLADLTNRALEGRQKYGEPLLAHNGRNPLWDAYQEALDLAMYLRQAIEESK